MTNSSNLSPTGDQDSGRLLERPALGGKMFEEVLSSENLHRAWKRVKQNGGAAGVDGMTIEEFPEFARQHWPRIRKEILNGRYQPRAVRRCWIAKSNGGSRPLGIPTVLDRVIQQALAQVLDPLFDSGFSESSFGFRVGRSAHQAVKQIQTYIGEGYGVSIEVDLRSFFDEVNHDILMSRVARKCRDKRVLSLIGRYLRSGVFVDGVIEATIKGVPQGGNLSPLLSNILLDDLDKELEKRGHRFARYADDFVIQVKSKRAGKRVKESISCFLERKLRLRVNRKKSNVSRYTKCTFLGFGFYAKGKLRVSEKALREFKHRVHQFTSRSHFISISKRIAELNRYLRGWFGYFGISQYWKIIVELDEWIRRRIRMCLLKAWRHVRKTVSELSKLGAPIARAIANAMSPCSYWAKAKFSSVHKGLTNRYLHDTLQLLSIRNLWISLHYPTGTAQCGPAC